MQCHEHGLGVIVEWDGYIYTECPICIDKEDSIAEPESLVKAKENHEACFRLTAVMNRYGVACHYIRELEADNARLRGKK